MSIFRNMDQPETGNISLLPGYAEHRKEVEETYQSVFQSNQRLGLTIAHGMAYQAAKQISEQLVEGKGAFKRFVHKLEGEGKSKESAGAIAAAVGNAKYGKKAMQKGARTGKPVSEDEVAEGDVFPDNATYAGGTAGGTGTPAKGLDSDKDSGGGDDKGSDSKPEAGEEGAEGAEALMASESEAATHCSKCGKKSDQLNGYNKCMNCAKSSKETIKKKLKSAGFNEGEIARIMAEAEAILEAEDDAEQDGGDKEVQDKNKEQKDKQDYCNKCGSVHADSDTCLGLDKEGPPGKKNKKQPDVGAFKDDKGDEEPKDAQKKYDDDVVTQTAAQLGKNIDDKRKKANEWENAENFFGEETYNGSSQKCASCKVAPGKPHKENCTGGMHDTDKKKKPEPEMRSGRSDYFGHYEETEHPLPEELAAISAAAKYMTYRKECAGTQGVITEEKK